MSRGVIMNEVPVEHRHPASRRGMWTIVAIFALGFAVLAGLYLSPKSQAPRLPATVTFGPPPQPVTGVLIDCRPLGGSSEAIVAGIRKLAPSPELLLLVDIESSLVPGVIEAFGMQKSYHAELFQRSEARVGGDRIGVCILSSHGLFEGTPIRVDRRSIGVASAVVAGDKAMHIRCVAVDDAALPAPPAHPKAITGESHLVLTAGRIGGAWQVTLSELAAEGLQAPMAASIVDITRREAPAAIVFSIKNQIASKTRPTTDRTVN
jgi:hypothetical protein